VSFPGRKTTDLMASLYPITYASFNPFVLVNIGVNDLNFGTVTPAQCEANVHTYCDRLVTGGITRSRIFVATLSTGGALNGDRDTYNDLLRANTPGYSGGVMDFAGDTGPGGIGCVVGQNQVITPAYFQGGQGGGPHWTNTGDLAVAAFVQNYFRGSVPWLN
jgi:hypothetical protein